MVVEFNVDGLILVGIRFVRRMPYKIKLSRGLLRPILSVSNFAKNDVMIDVNGLLMTLNVRSSLFQRGLAFYPKHIDCEMIAYLEANLRSDDVFVDAGAHAGYYSLVAARKIGASGKVVAIEADPYNIEYIERNIAQNEMTTDTRVSVCSGAIGDEEGILTLEINRNNRGSNFVSEKSIGESVEIPADSLKGWLDRSDIPRIDAIKLDIEGSERVALESMFRDFEPSCLPRFIIIEINSNFEESRLLAQILFNHGYRVDTVAGDNHVFTRLGI